MNMQGTRVDIINYEMYIICMSNDDFTSASDVEMVEICVLIRGIPST